MPTASPDPAPRTWRSRRRKCRLSSVHSDGNSNWLEGAQLLAVYLILGIVFFFLPDAPELAVR